MRSRRGPPTSTARRNPGRRRLAPQRRPGAEVEQLADAFLASESVIRIAESPKGERFTTRRIWELERRGAGGGGADAGRRTERPPASWSRPG